MSGTLRDFESLREVLQGRSPLLSVAPRVPPPALAPRGPVASQNVPPPRRRVKRSVTVGLDFGTRFSKTCYQVDDDGRAAVLAIGGANDAVLHPSRLFIDGDTGAVSTKPTAKGFELPYLKMRLKDPGAALFQPDSCIERHVGTGTESALAALYLSSVLGRARALIMEREEARLAGAEVIWEVNLSVPAQYQDEGVSNRFQEVGEVALLWSEQAERPPETVPDLCRRFAADLPSALGRRRVTVFPEIVAALHHFISQRDTPEGIHGFLDIGGGTLDGCVFRLQRQANGPDLGILAAHVAPLGTVAMARKAVAELDRDLTTIEERIVAAPGDGLAVYLPLDSGLKDLETFIEKLLDVAKKRCLNHVLRQPFTTYEADPTKQRFSGDPTDVDVVPGSEP